MGEKYTIHELSPYYSDIRCNDTILTNQEVIDKLNQQENEIKELKKEIDDIWEKYEIAHGVSIRNTDWY